ncbi:hypothetical protein DENIS_0134 [Desulfonema ishimotonii]|uniref:LTD domain-containing protein n=1 Tax=Desulfonema ishimotonii TaxID=45657 RepID=A0A401FQD3_9BACT|nr:CotH kinase family protein [Desulfonema ishimotonii]GBC59198.1 hypothetical protein DENIS_0134 [Desulfonema ishimotonii]
MMAGKLKNMAVLSIVFLFIWGIQESQAGEVMISEFMASNTSTLSDKDGDYSDWIEIHNGSDSELNLEGWYLTDDVNTPDKWQFPAVSISPGAFLVVFASGKNVDDPAELHTGFKLSKGGEYLGLVLPDLTVASEYAPQYPEQETDVSYGYGPDGLPQYFHTPTPNQPNSQDNAGEIIFSHQGGLYSAPFSLTLTVSPPGAMIRYTTDRSEPTETSPVYSGEIHVDGTVMIKAKAFKTDLPPGSVASQSYLKLESDVRAFSSNLPIVVVDTFGYDIKSTAFPYCPVFSVFISPGDDGRARILNSPDLTSNAGIRIRGHSSATDDWEVTSWPKKQYRLELWDDEGEDRKAPLLGLPSDSDWVLYAPYSDKTLMRNHLTYAWSNRMGRYAARTRFVEVFLNADGGNISESDYVGVYVFMEKIQQGKDRVDITELTPEDENEPEITGGYLFLKDRIEDAAVAFRSSAVGDDVAIHYVAPDADDITAQQKTYAEGYFTAFETALYGSDFTDPGSGYAAYIDADSFIDHQLLVELTKNLDGLKYSTYMFKDREKKLHAGPVWDYNLSLGNSYYRNGPDDEINSKSWSYNPWMWQARHKYSWWGRLFEDPDYQQQWNDRWAELRKDLLSNDQIFQDIDETAAMLAEAAGRNFDRWQILGKWVWGNLDGFEERDIYQKEVDAMKAWLETRLIFMDKVTFTKRMPTFEPAGGAVTAGTQISLNAPKGGTIYYTLDGSDPRDPGGTINKNAINYDATGPISIDQFLCITARIYFLEDEDIDDNGKTEYVWTPPVTVSYVKEGEYANLSVSEIMYNPVGTDVVDGDEFEFIELRNTGAEAVLLDGINFSAGVDFTFPAGTILNSGAYAVIVSNESEFNNLYPDVPVAGVYAGRLDNGGETLTLSDGIGRTLFSVTYDDEAPWPVGADNGGGSLIRFDYDISPDSAAAWTTCTCRGGSPGQGNVNLCTVIAALQLMAGHTSDAPPTEDINGDRRIGLEEAIFLLQEIADLR